MRTLDGNRHLLLRGVIACALLSGIAACGGDGAADDQPAVTQAVADGAVATVSDQPAQGDGGDVDAAASGLPSEPFADLDMPPPPAGTGSVEFADHTVEFTPSCMPPAQMEHMEQQGFLNVQAGGSGTMPDGTGLEVRVNRSVRNADETWSEGEYEIDNVTFILVADTPRGDQFASTRALVARSEVGGTVRQLEGSSDGLPMVKIRPDGQAMTATGSTETLHSTSPGDDAAILGPFRLAMTCE
jgi:hypothetical protein